MHAPVGNAPNGAFGGQVADIGSNELVLADAFNDVGQVGQHAALIQISAACEVGVHDVGSFAGVDCGSQLGVHFIEGNSNHFELEAHLCSQNVHLSFQSLQLVLVGVVIPNDDLLLLSGSSGSGLSRSSGLSGSSGSGSGFSGSSGGTAGDQGSHHNDCQEQC